MVSAPVSTEPAPHLLRGPFSVSVARGPCADHRVGSGGSKETPPQTLQPAQGEGGARVQPEGPQRPPCPGQTRLA